MASDQNKVGALYKKLLAFYPGRFKEQLGESMLQTFHDLYQEQKQGTNRERFTFLLWMFIETALAIFREHLQRIKQGDVMKHVLANFRAPAWVSFVLVLPFMVLEEVNRRTFNEGFPFPLFVIMWVLPALVILMARPIVRHVRAGNSIAANPVLLLLRVVLLTIFVSMWLAILMDQMPCFLGVPKCD